MESTEKHLPSLAACYGLLACLSVVSLLCVPIPPFSVTDSSFLASLTVAAQEVQKQAHTTWIAFAIFAVAWVLCLGWGVFEIRRSGMDLDRKDGTWTAGMTLLVLTVSVFYALGTQGEIGQNFPIAVPVSDGIGVAFILILPWLVSMRIAGKEREEARWESDSRRRHGFEPFSEEKSAERLIEALTSAKVVAVDPLPVHSAQNRAPNQPATKAAVAVSEAPVSEPVDQPVVKTGIAWAIKTPAEPATAPTRTASVAASSAAAAAAVRTTPQAPVTVSPPAPAPEIPSVAQPLVNEPASSIVNDQERKYMDQPIERTDAPAVTPAAAVASVSEGAELFRENLKVLNESWDAIEKAGKELEQWFDAQRKAAVAHLARPPLSRVDSDESPQAFLKEKLASVDADWAKIRHAALEISRLFGDVPPEKTS
ncbi:hypothetical protein [Silvibacterium acidisoli]|uniref:hypothetical protein n=1 Tax=Acidobacteriaceae bacterium ZG23-2 TaxID=2883246 RepID=UPI00406C932E